MFHAQLAAGVLPSAKRCRGKRSRRRFCEVKFISSLRAQERRFPKSNALQRALASSVCAAECCCPACPSVVCDRSESCVNVSTLSLASAIATSIRPLVSRATRAATCNSADVTAASAAFPASRSRREASIKSHRGALMPARSVLPIPGWHLPTGTRPLPCASTSE